MKEVVNLSNFRNDANSLQMFSVVDPYVYQTLLSIVRRTVVVQTSEGSIRGVLVDVKPDHIAVEVSGSTFFIRTQCVVWVKPE
jgi:hypothetical protein